MDVEYRPGGNQVPRSKDFLLLIPYRPDEISFSCPTGRGAVLSLPVSAQREDTVALGEFAKYIVKHIDQWFAFARELGAGISRREDIVLVTGCDFARSWANIAFQEGDGDVSFELQVLAIPM
jgi:hypothetical protein